MDHQEKKRFYAENDQERNELERLIACYQIASIEDQKVVWAVLNKYATKIDGLAP